MTGVGEYVRTKRGIAKVLEVKTVKTKMYGKHDVAYLIDKCPRMYITETVFIKHSKNIIDLIEVGDIVNGYRILNIVDLANSNKKVFTICKSDFKDICRVWGEEDIETILTKEQYIQNCYKVNDAGTQ